MSIRLGHYRPSVALAIGLALFPGCDAAGPPAASPAGRATPPLAVGSLRPVADTVACLSVAPRAIAIRGVVRRVAFFGAPSYGETPAQDRRDTVPVLVLAAPLTACVPAAGLPASVRDRAPAPPAPTARIQLVGGSEGVDWQLADSITVYGTLRPADWGWHYTSAILEVDSIPTLRPRPQPRFSGRSGASHGRLTLRCS